MAVTNVTANALSTLIREFAPERCMTALQASSPLMADNSILDKKTNVKGELTFTVFPAENFAGGMVSDFGNLPAGGADIPSKGRVLPQPFVEVVQMGRAAVDMEVTAEGVVEMFQSNIDNRSRALSRKINSAIYGGAPQPSAGTTWNATTANATATVAFTDASLFRPGAAYDFCDLSSGNTYVVRCTAVAYTSNVAANVSFINDVPSATGSVTALTDTTIATGDTFRIRGAGGPGFGTTTVLSGMISFDSIAGTGAAATLHGIAPASLPGWTGQNRALGAAFTQEASAGFTGLLAQISGSQFTHVLCGPQTAAAIAVSGGVQGSVLSSGGAAPALGGAGRYDLGSVNSDKYEGLATRASGKTGLTLHGRPVVEDISCPASTIVYHCRDTTKLAVWKAMGPQEEAGDPLLVDRTTYSFSTQIDWRGNLYTNQRASIGIMTGVTAL